MPLRISVKSSSLDSFRPIIKNYNKPEVVIGRHSSNDFVLDQEGVSERHARIRLSGSGLGKGSTKGGSSKEKRLYVTDLGSAAGVKVGDTKIKAYKEVEVKPEEVVKIGNFILSSELQEGYLKSGKKVFAKKKTATKETSLGEGRAKNVLVEKNITADKQALVNSHDSMFQVEERVANGFSSSSPSFERVASKRAGTYAVSPVMNGLSGKNSSSNVQLSNQDSVLNNLASTESSTDKHYGKALGAEASDSINEAMNGQKMKVIKVAERKGVFKGNMFSKASSSGASSSNESFTSRMPESETVSNATSSSQLPPSAFKKFTSQYSEQKSFQEKLAETKAALVSRKLQQSKTGAEGEKNGRLGFTGVGLGNLLGRKDNIEQRFKTSVKSKKSSLSNVFDEASINFDPSFEESANPPFSNVNTIELSEELKDNTGISMADSNSSFKGNSSDSNPLAKIAEANKAAAAEKNVSDDDSAKSSLFKDLKPDAADDKAASFNPEKMSSDKISSENEKNEPVKAQSGNITNVQNVDVDLSPKNSASFEASALGSSGLGSSALGSSGLSSSSLGSSALSSPTQGSTSDESFTTKINVVNIDDFDLEATKLIPLRGRVSHRGMPLAGVMIDGGAFGKTQSLEDGSFHFAPAAEGTIFKLEGTKEGYMVNCQNSEGTISDGMSVEFFATKLLSISGRVVYQGKAIAGVEIDSGRFGKIVTDQDGRYTIKNVPEETEISIVAKKEGYVFKKISTTV